jgi:flagellar biosynthesis protein FliR
VSLTLNATALIAFLLALVRAGAWMLAMPIFGDRAVIPPIATVCSAAGLALLAAPSVPASMIPTDVPGLIGAIVVQAVTGFAMGYVITLILQSFTAAGSLLDLAGGLNLPSAVDPLSLNQTPMIGQFYEQVAMLLLFATGGYLEIVSGFVHSFTLQGITLSGLHNVAVVGTADLATLFDSALEMAGPVLIALFAVQVALALLARAAPQVNVWMLGMPLQIFLSLALVAVAISTIPAYMTGALGHAVYDVRALFATH